MSWGCSPALSVSPSCHPLHPRGDRSPCNLAQGASQSSLMDPLPPAASQSHQVSRFTCRARPSAQEPVASRTATPQLAAQPAQSLPRPPHHLSRREQWGLQGSPRLTVQPMPMIAWHLFL